MGRKFYSEEFKLFAAQMALTGGQSKAQVARDLGVSESVLHRWVAQYASGAISTRHPAAEQPAQIVAAQRESLRNEHARRLDFIYHQAEEAWAATRAERRRSNLAKCRQALGHERFAGASWGEEVIDNILDIVDTIFAGHSYGDPRFLEKMLSALADERRMWDANLSGKKPLPQQEVHFDEDYALSDDERIVLLRKLFDDARTRHDATTAAPAVPEAATAN